MNTLSKISLSWTLFAAISASAFPVDVTPKQLAGPSAVVFDTGESADEDGVVIQGFDDLELFREAADYQDSMGTNGLIQYVQYGESAKANRKELRILINKKDQSLVVYENAEPVFADRIPVSTGGGLHVPKNGQPPVCGITPTGDFRFALTEDRFFTNYFSKKYEAWVKWAVHIHDGVFMHQAPTAQAEKIIGRPASGGCIRMRAKDAKRVYLYLAQNKGEMLTVSIVGDDRKELAKCQNSAAFKAAMVAYQSGESNSEVIEKHARDANKSQVEQKNNRASKPKAEALPAPVTENEPTPDTAPHPVIKGLKALWPFKAL